MAGWCANTTQLTTNTSRAVLSSCPCSPTLAHASNIAAYLPRLSTTGFSCSSPSEAEAEDDAGGPTVGLPDATSLDKDAVSALRSTAFRSCGCVMTVCDSTPIVDLRMSESVVCTARWTNTAPNATLITNEFSGTTREMASTLPEVLVLEEVSLEFGHDEIGCAEEPLGVFGLGEFLIDLIPNKERWFG